MSRNLRLESDSKDEIRDSRIQGSQNSSQTFRPHKSRQNVSDRRQSQGFGTIEGVESTENGRATGRSEASRDTTGNAGVSESSNEDDIDNGTISLQKRIAEELAKPPKRPRRTKKSMAASAVDDDDEKLRMLDRKIRWMVFLYFSKSQWLDLVKEVYGDIPADFYDFITARAKIFDNTKSYKHRVLAQMELHVEELMKSDSLLVEYHTENLLCGYFDKSYNASNFIYVFPYMDGYLDVDRSSSLGIFYCKSVYVNLAVETKLHLDTVASGEGIADSRQNLLDFYNTIPIHPDFKNVDKGDFFKIANRSRKQRKNTKEPNLSGLKRFRSRGIPPPKGAPLSSGRSGAEGESI